jgi:2-aminoadipate transaminase
MITTSAQQGLDLVGRLFLDPGDAVVLERPTFGGAIAAFQMQRPEFLGVELTSGGVDIEGLQALLEKRSKGQGLPKFIYVVPDFQNPSGVTMGLEQRHALLEISERFRVPVVEDSPYRSLRYRGEDIPSLYALDQQLGGQRVIGIYTFSKLFCPGMRVGFTIGPQEVIEQMTRIKEGGTLCTPKYNQDMCTAFLTRIDLEGYFQRCRAYYGAKMNTILASLESHFPPHRGVSWTRPEGGMFLWVSLPKTVDTRKLFHQALAFRVAFVPGEAFYAEQHEHHHMRVNFSFPSRDQIREAVRRLSDCLESRFFDEGGGAEG